MPYEPLETLAEETDTCPFCKGEHPSSTVKKRSYVAKVGNIGRLTSEQPMCDNCFNLIRKNTQLQ